MNARTIILPIIAALAAAAAPPLDGNEGQVLAERRLRACLAANSGQGTLEAAVAAARAACGSQIRKVRDQRLIDATAGLAPEAARVVERRVTRALNHEIAQAVASLTGLPLPNAHSHAHD